MKNDKIKTRIWRKISATKATGFSMMELIKAYCRHTKAPRLLLSLFFSSATEINQCQSSYMLCEAVKHHFSFSFSF